MIPTSQMWKLRPEVKQLGSVQLGLELLSELSRLERKLKLSRLTVKECWTVLTAGYLITFWLFMHLTLFKVITINTCLKADGRAMWAGI